MDELYTITRQMHLLEFDKSCGFISEGEFEWRMNGLRNGAAQIEQERWRKRRRARLPFQRIWKELGGCMAAFYLLIPRAPLETFRATFNIGVVPWFVTLLFLSLLFSYVVAQIIGFLRGKR
jgi:hypothetical protein